MTDLFFYLVRVSIPASLMILIILMLRLILSKAPKRWRLILWSMVALRLVLPVSITSSLSLLPPMKSFSVLGSTGRPSAEPLVTLADVTTSAVHAGNHAAAAASSSLPEAAAWVWLAGAVCMTGCLLVQSLRLRKRLAAAVHMSGNVFQADAAVSPFVFGLFRPKVYLPFHICRQALPYILLHEQSHVRHGDLWWKLVGFLLLSVYWFNPCLWAAYLFFSQDLELACDERVIRRMPPDARADYAEALLVCTVPQRLTAAPLAFDGGQLKGRIRAVLGFKKPTFWILAAAILAGLVVGVCFLTFHDSKLPLPLKQNAEARLWIAEDALDASAVPELQLDAFPGVTFRWRAGCVEAEQNGETEVLLNGCPVWNVYLCDLTGDGKPEFCSVVSFGSGWIDDRVVIYDYAARQSFEIEQRFSYDYQLSLSGTDLILSRREVMSPESPPIETKSLSAGAWLTQADVVQLASKGSALSFDDLAMYPFQYGITGLLSRYYPVEGGYSLCVITSSDSKQILDLVLSDADNHLTLYPETVSEKQVRAFFK